MLIEIAAPASLPLGLVRFENKICLLGLTVQHPPVNLFAGSYPRLQISGPRADKGYEQATRFLDNLHLKPQAQVDIEYAVPMFVGLGSEGSLGLSIAKALAWVHNLPSEQQTMPLWAQALGLGPSHVLEYWGVDQGGLLLVDVEPEVEGHMPRLLRRQEIEHTEREAWSLVFYFPNVPDETPETLEADRLAALLKAAPHLSQDSGHLVDEELWPAVDSDDIERFGQALLALQQMNEAALSRAGTTLEISTEDQTILDIMRDSGAVAWGQNLTGLSLYGLVKGGQASRELRKKLRAHVGFFGGIVLATITDNRGLGATVKEENLTDPAPPALRINPATKK